MEKLKFKYFDEINDYFYGGMSEEEKLLFEAQIILNNDLAGEIAVFRQVSSDFKELHYRQLKSELQSLDKDLDKELNHARFASRTLSFRSLSITCSLILILGFICWSIWFKNDPGTIAKYEEVEIGLPVKMGEGNLQFDKAMSLYKQKQFLQSLKILEQLETESPTDTIEYYLGINLYELANYPAALKSFKKVEGGSVFYEKSRYRSALSYLHLNQPQKAKPILTELISSASQYSNKAKQILLEIEY